MKRIALAADRSPSRSRGLGVPRLAAHGSKSASDLRTGYNALLAEHVFLAGAATDAALGGRQAEFEAAAAALDANSQDLATSIGSVYGPDAEKAFLPLWRKHIGMVVDYTVGLATRDKTKQDKAVAELVALYAGLRRLPRRRQPEPPEGGGGRSREASRADAQERDRPSGRRQSSGGLPRAPRGRRPHDR